MRAKPRRMHVAKITRRYRGKTYVSFLLRRSYRVGAQVKHENLANLSCLPEATIDLIRRSLRGENLVPAQQAFHILRSLPHGHVQAVLGTLRALGLETLIAPRPCRERNLVVALIVARLLFPSSKLAAIRRWRSCTLADTLGVANATIDEVYQAMDWLLRRQAHIEGRLAERHLAEKGQVLYDVSSSYYHGRTCPLAQYGYSRDGKKGLPIIVYGLLTDADGRPVALDVYRGNTADPTTVADQVVKLRQRFGLQRVVLVGDRGMLTQTQIKHLRKHPGLGWISALRSNAIRELLAKEHLRRTALDEVNLAEIRSPDFPGERLIACYNARLAEERCRKRQELLAATEADLQRLAAEVQRRTRHPLSAADIGLKAGRLLGQHKLAKHFHLQIAHGRFAWSRREDKIRREEQLDGIYVIRTSEKKRAFPAARCVRTYKRLTLVERAFRCLKGLDLQVRPIYHRVEPRVRAHLFLCLLAYYVEWEMRRAWAPLLYEDEEVDDARDERDPVARAEPSESAQAKKQRHRTEAGEPVHSFRTLLEELATRTRNTCTVAGAAPAETFELISDLTYLQAEALRLLGL